MITILPTNLRQDNREYLNSEVKKSIKSGCGWFID